MEETVMARKQEGKYHNRTRLNVLIMSAQYNEFRRIAEVCGLTTTDAIGEAVQVWINQQRGMGI